MPDILILCPTHDHADTLFASLASVQAQTIQNWEMVVLCDGSPQRTHDVLGAIMKRDPRISSIRFEKSPRFGENHRDAIIRRSKASIICQVSDDDLWLPRHLEVMSELLDDADWANQAPIRIEHQAAHWWPVNMGTTRMRASLVSGIPLAAGPNFVAYRREAYLALPEGWTCAPPDAGPSDAYMWAKFFRQAGLKTASSARTTALKFPSHIGERKTLTPEDRLGELAPWLARLAEPGLERMMTGSASILQRMIQLFAVNGVGASPEASAQRAGLAPCPADHIARPAHQGEPMALPLTIAQLEQLRLAHEFLAALEGGALHPATSLIEAIRTAPAMWQSEARNLALMGRSDLVPAALAITDC